MKYRLRKDLSIQVDGITLYRVEYLSTGELGGYIEKEANLSQRGDAWVYGNARVSGNAWVSGNAQVYGDAWVYGNARVYGYALVYGNAWVSGNALVYGNAQVCGNAQVYGYALVYGNAWVSGNARVSGNAKLTKLSNIIHIAIPQSYNITITPQNISIGCKVFTHKQCLAISKARAVKMGLKAEVYSMYRNFIKEGIKAVKRGKNE